MADDKICTRCERLLPIDKFGSRRRPSGNEYPKPWCRKCESDTRRLQRVEQGKLNPPQQCKPPVQRPTEKTCRKCQQELPIELFYDTRAICGPCHNIDSAERRRRIKSPDYKQCNACRRWLLLAQFGKAASGNRRGKCNSCETAERRKREAEKKKAAEAAANASRVDAEYDYRFARNILGLSKAQALEWVARGYENCDDDLIYDWGLHLEEARTSLPTTTR